MTGIYGFGAVVRHTVRRHGAAVARGIHNPEGTRSKRVAGIYHHIAMVHQGTGATLTGMAQRQRAGLITPRTPDRNGLPVSIIRPLYRSG